MPDKHAYFSPSASPRWIPCPTSLFLSEKSSSETSSYAHEGIVCHDLAATCLTKNIVASSYAGQVIEGVAMTPELIDSIQMYVDEIRGLVKEFKADGGKIEHEVELTDDCWGTADAMLWNSEVLIIGDLKMGKGVVVSAEDNSQLKLYSVGGLKWLVDKYQLAPKRVINIIIQPRTVNPVRRYELTRDELASWFKTDVLPILQSYKKGVKPEAPCNPGAVQCRWCPITGHCYAQSDKAMNDAQFAFAPFTAIEKPEVEVAEVETLTVELAAKYKKSFDHIQQWMKTVNEFLNERALAGEKIPGFKLVEGRSNRKWGADEKQVVAFLEDFIEPHKKTLISPTQAEKAMGKKQAKEHNLNQFITKPPGAPTLVSQSDTRPEMEAPVEEGFKEFVVSEKIFPDVREIPGRIITSEFADTPRIPPGVMNTPLIVDNEENEEGVQRLSALQRMQMAEMEDEVEKVELSGASNASVAKVLLEPIDTALKKVIQTATGGDPEVVETMKSTKSSQPPKENTKRYQILNFGKGGAYIKDAAAALGCSENMIRMHLRYLYERDAYSYEIYSNGTFKVKEVK